MLVDSHTHDIVNKIHTLTSGVTITLTAMSMNATDLPDCFPSLMQMVFLRRSQRSRDKSSGVQEFRYDNYSGQCTSSFNMIHSWRSSFPLMTQCKQCPNDAAIICPHYHDMWSKASSRMELKLYVMPELLQSSFTPTYTAPSWLSLDSQYHTAIYTTHFEYKNIGLQ